MKTRFLAVILALCMVLPLLPLVGVLSFAGSGVKYIDENGQEQSYTGTFANFKSEDPIGKTGQTTWIYYNENYTRYGKDVYIWGDVRVILKDGITVNIGPVDSYLHPYGFNVRYGASLTFYAQSTDKNTCGKVIASFIGGTSGCGNITINGGNFDLSIGNSRFYRSYSCMGTYATLEGENWDRGGCLTINNGFIHAVGSSYAAGLGGSVSACINTITINGGEINSTGGYGGPGIGPGAFGGNDENITININGGTIVAQGGESAAGIGTGYEYCGNCTININGGDITANGGRDIGSPAFDPDAVEHLKGGPGIGAGSDAHGKMTVNINGGTVKASSLDGAAIGSGHDSLCETTVNITGGTVTAYAGKEPGSNVVNYGAGIRRFWEGFEKRLLADWPVKLKKAANDAVAEKRLSAFTLRAQRNALDAARFLLDDLLWYITANNRHQGDVNGGKPFEVKPYVPPPLAAMPIHAVWPQREKLKAETIAKSGGKFDLVFVGDSITHNWENPGRGKEVCDELAKTYSILNLGYSGNRTEGVIWRLTYGGELDGYKAKLFMVMIGINNGADTATDVAAGIRRIVELILSRQPQAEVLLLPIFPLGVSPDSPARVKNGKVNERISKLADGKRVHWCDFNDRLLDKDGRYTAEIAPDACHPHEKGYQIWRDAVLPHFRRVCGK